MSNQIDVFTNIQNIFLQKDEENKIILEKHDMGKLINDVLDNELYTNLFSSEQIMKKLSTMTILLIYNKIVNTSYNESNHIQFWHLVLLIDIYKKTNSKVKIACYDILHKLNLSYTPKIENLLILNKIFIEKYLIDIRFTSEELHILRMDEEKILFTDITKNSELYLDTYSDSQIYNDLFLSREFMNNLSLDTLVYIFNRILKSEYNKNTHLSLWQMDILLTKYNLNKSNYRKLLEDIIINLNYEFSDELITLLIKNYYYLEKYFSNKELTKNKFIIIVSKNCSIDFSKKCTDRFTNVIDFFLLMEKNYKFTYNLLAINNFISCLKYNAKNHSEFMYSKYPHSTTKLGFNFSNNHLWYRY